MLRRRTANVAIVSSGKLLVPFPRQFNGQNLLKRRSANVPMGRSTVRPGSVQDRLEFNLPSKGVNTAGTHLEKAGTLPYLKKEKFIGRQHEKAYLVAIGCAGASGHMIRIIGLVNQQQGTACNGCDQAVDALAKPGALGICAATCRSCGSETKRQVGTK
jgi:hypothetical protein